MDVIKSKYDWIVIAAIAVLALALALSIESCAPRLYTYKVTFQNGNVEYYELNYKPKKDSKVIEYEGETLIGVESIEKLK